MVLTIITFVLSVAKQLLPALMPKIIEWLQDVDPVKVAKRDTMDAVIEGDLSKLSAINQILIDATGQSDLTDDQLKMMENF